MGILLRKKKIKNGLKNNKSIKRNCNKPKTRLIE